MCTICNIVQRYQKRPVVNALSTTPKLSRTVLLNPSLSDLISRWDSVTLTATKSEPTGLNKEDLPS